MSRKKTLYFFQRTLTPIVPYTSPGYYTLRKTEKAKKERKEKSVGKEIRNLFSPKHENQRKTDSKRSTI
jgi:hypothetical protein